MSGFDTQTDSPEYLTVVSADNASFDGTERGGVLQTNGQLWIGATTPNANNTHINVGEIVSATLNVTYDSPNIRIESGGGGMAVDSFAMQTGTNPVVPTAAGLVTFNGSSVAQGVNPVRTNGTGANTMQLEVQTASAVAATDATRIGLASFDSDIFTVDANGFVSTTAGSLVQTITGGPGITITGTASDPIVNSVVFSDVTATTLAVDQGYFATAAGTYDLPATAAQGELIHIIADTAGAVVVDAPAGDFIRIGNVISSDGGTVTSNAIGDSLTLRFRSSSQTWIATAVQGTWTLA